MLFRKLSTMASGCQRNKYMTNAHDKLAKAGQARSVILVRASGEMKPDKGCMLGWMDSLARASTTRAKT